MQDKFRGVWILAAMSLGLSTVFMHQTAVCIALPQIQHDLNLTTTASIWVLNAYYLALAMLAILAGKLSDQLDSNRVFLIASSVFLIFSAAAAMAVSGWQLIACSGLQGISAAFMVPASMTLVFHAYPSPHRGKAMRIYIGVSSIFLTLGPLVGGMLTQSLNWRWVFIINIPLCLLSIILALIFVPKDKPQGKPLQIDIFGFLFQSIAIFSLIFGLMQVGVLGWSAAVVVGCLMTFLLSTALFIFIEKHHPHPLVDFSLLRSRDYRHSTLLVFLMQMILVVIVFWAIYLQKVLYFSPLVAGLLLLPATLPILFAPAIARKLCDRYDACLPSTVGSMLVMCAIFGIGITAMNLDYLYFLPAFILYGCGISLVMSSALATSHTSVTLSKQSMAISMTAGARQLGSTLGLAIMSAIMHTVGHLYYDWNRENESQPIASISAETIEGLLTKNHPAEKIIANLPSHNADQLISIVVNANVEGFAYGMYFLGILAMIAFFISLRLPDKS